MTKECGSRTTNPTKSLQMRRKNPVSLFPGDPMASAGQPGMLILLNWGTRCLVKNIDV